MDKKVFIDSNIFLEIFLKDKKSEECKKILVDVKDKGGVAVTTDFIIYSCILIIQNSTKSPKSVRNVIIFFNSYNNLRILRPSFDDIHNAGEIMEDKKLDFDDSLVVSCMKSNNINKLASLDKHFDKIKDIEKISLDNYKNNLLF